MSAVLAVIVFAFEAAAQLHAIPVTDPALVYQFEGYRVLPPPGKNWFEMQRNGQQALFGKKIDSPTHSFVATATSGLIEETFDTREQFQEYVTRQRTADLDSARYRTLEFAATVDNLQAAWCIRYRMKRTDRDAVLARSRTLLLEDSGVSCLHPEKKNLLVDVGYSERGRPAEISAELRKEGENFMRSLEFIRP